jgi:hypothetical protein
MAVVGNRSQTLFYRFFNDLQLAHSLLLPVHPPLLKRRNRRNEMKTKLMILAFLVGGTLFAQPRVYIAARFGYAPAPVVVRVAPPAPLVAYAVPAPGPGYSWVGGYWYPAGARYAWHAGYWTRPAFAGARWVGPRYAVGHYYGGYWRR